MSDSDSDSDSDGDYEERPNKKTKLLNKLSKSSVPTKAIRKLLRTHKLFSMSPCDEELDFEKRYGLIKLSENMPSYDRFQSEKIPDTTLSYIISLIARDILYSSEFRGNNQEVVPILDRLFTNLGRFTRPPPQKQTNQLPEEETNQLPGEETFEGEKTSKKFNLAIEVAVPAHEHIDPELEAILQKLVRQQHASVKLSVHKKLHTVNGLHLKVVNDWKTSVSLDDIYQPAIYAIDELKTTADFPKAYRPPVYLMTQDMTWWYYAILEIDGYIKVKDRVIDPVSLEGFPEAREDVNPNKFTPSFTRSEVSTKFAEWKNVMEEDGMFIPDGLYPVGRLFKKRFQHYEVPQLVKVADQTTSSGEMMYYDGLLKILVGSRVTKWPIEDAMNAWNARKSLEEKIWKNSGVPETFWPKEFQTIQKE